MWTVFGAVLRLGIVGEVRASVSTNSGERAEEGDGGRAEEQEEKEEARRTFTLDNTVRCKELPDL